MNMSFEQKMDRITEIAEILDRGLKPLEDSLNLYREAKDLIASIKNELSDARGSVVIMRKSIDGSYNEEQLSSDGL